VGRDFDSVAQWSGEDWRQDLSERLSEATTTEAVRRLRREIDQHCPDLEPAVREREVGLRGAELARERSKLEQRIRATDDPAALEELAGELRAAHADLAEAATTRARARREEMAAAARAAAELRLADTATAAEAERVADLAREGGWDDLLEEATRIVAERREQEEKEVQAAQLRRQLADVSTPREALDLGREATTAGLAEVAAAAEEVAASLQRKADEAREEEEREARAARAVARAAFRRRRR